ncbi:MAG: nicotinate-nucleotide adenylyltransferase [Candidatus Omnitrophota bacterium]
MKIGILGGTFNPVHIGHLILAEEAREKLGLDKVIFIPTALPPHKDNVNIAPAEDRLKMLKLATKSNKYFAVSDIEIRRGGKSYTIDTVNELKQKYPTDSFYLIIGSDLITYFDGWKDIDKIAKAVTFVVATRPGYPLEDIGSYVASRQLGAKILPIRAVDVSGFEVRQCVQQGKSFGYLVMDKVFDHIKRKKLYK